MCPGIEVSEKKQTNYLRQVRNVIFVYCFVAQRGFRRAVIRELDVCWAKAAKGEGVRSIGDLTFGCVFLFFFPCLGVPVPPWSKYIYISQQKDCSFEDTPIRSKQHIAADKKHKHKHKHNHSLWAEQKKIIKQTLNTHHSKTL